MRSPGPESPSMTEEALLHGQFGGWSSGGGSGSNSNSCPNSPGGVSLPSSPASTNYALTLTQTHIHVQRLSPRAGKQSRLILPLAELTGCSCPRSPAPPLLVLYWYPPGRRRKGVSRHRQVRAYLAESRVEAEKWNAAIQSLLRGMDVSSTTEFCKSMLPRPRRLLLLVNPFSGRGQAMQWCQTHILPMIREANISYNLIQTERQNHARELIREISLPEWDGIIIVSGDGLLHECRCIGCSVPTFTLIDKVHVMQRYDMCLREPLLLNCSFLLCRGGVKPMDLVSVTTSPCTSSTTNQNGHPPAPRRLFSFLSVAWGFVSDVDIESERYRGLGSARFTLGTLVRLASLRSYKGRLSYLPPAMVNSSPDATPQPPRRPLSRSITEGLEGFCRTPIHRTCSDMGLSEQRSLRKGDGERERERERERQERERERERRRERARGVGVVRASSLAEDREREVEAEEKMEETSGTSSESTEREECDNIASNNGNGEEEEENKLDGDEVDGEVLTKARDLNARDEGTECNENYQTTPPEMQRTRKNSAPSSQIISAFFSQPIGADTDQDLEVAAYGKEDEDINGTYFQREAFPLDKSRERALTISSSPFRQSPFKAFKPKTLDQNQNPSRPRPLSLLQQSHSNSLPPKFPSLSLSLSPTPPSSPSCASPHSSYLAPRPNTPSSSSPSPSFHSPPPSFNFDLAEPAGPLKNRPHVTSSINMPEDNLLPPLDQPLPTRDWVNIEGDFVLVLAIYQTHLGADLLAAPQAQFDDGLIHLTFVRAGISRATLLRLFLAMERGAHLSLSSPYVHPSMARLIVGDSGIKITRF
ncbi:Sphingosine kinase 2 [Labeo rohita]|uniref:Sphingosine kinase 2 n=1 Tax=Labeo rohita TaxID=84645 RepID=A0ABQ8LWX7_LABRO|nr:Sphingosine kinase 2 [Labeo rohita]